MNKLEKITELLVDELEQFDINVKLTSQNNSNLTRERQQINTSLEDLKKVSQNLNQLEIKPKLTELENLEKHINTNLEIYKSGIVDATQKAIYEFTQAKSKRLFWHQTTITILSFGVLVICITSYKSHQSMTGKLNSALKRSIQTKNHFEDFILQNEEVLKEYNKWEKKTNE